MSSAASAGADTSKIKNNKFFEYLDSPQYKDEKLNEDFPWDECMSKMQGQGYDEETAQKSCAAIKNRTVAHMISSGVAKTPADAVAAIAEKVKTDKTYSYLLGKHVIEILDSRKKLIRNEFESVKARLISEKKQHDDSACMAEMKKMHPDWSESDIASACETKSEDKAEGGKEEVGYTVSKVATNTTNSGQVVVKPNLKKLNHTFKWPLPIDLKGKKPSDYMLIKGAAMTEGDAKRGEHMTKENLMHGAGAMSAFAMLGLSNIDIDHFATALPDVYERDYPGISKPYPPGVMIDAAVDKNTVDGKDVHQVEFIAFLTNPKVYEMVQKGEFLGTSVVDMFRKENCDCGASQSEHACTKCSIEGSHFIHNTLVLKGVPNSNGTWVAPVTEEDLGTIIVNAGKDNVSNNAQVQTKLTLLERAHMIKKEYDAEMDSCMKEMSGAHPEMANDQMVAACMNKLGRSNTVNKVEGTPITFKINIEGAEYSASALQKINETLVEIKKNASDPTVQQIISIQGNVTNEKDLIAAVDKHLVEKMRERGLGSNTVTHTIAEFYSDADNAVVMDTPEKITAAEAFLTDKGLTPEMAHGIAMHLKSNPKVLSKSQLERASAADLSAWYSHLRLNSISAGIENVERVVSLITKIRPHKDSVTFAEALEMVENYNQHTVKKPLLTKADAKYAIQNADAPAGCKACKWFIANAADPTSVDGFCSMVEGRINIAGHCDNFAKIDAPVKVEQNTEVKPVEASAPSLDAAKQKLNEDPAAKIAEAATAGAAVQHSVAEVVSATVNTPAGAPEPTAMVNPKVKRYSIDTTGKTSMTVEEVRKETERLEKMTPMGGRTTNMNNYTQLLKQSKEFAKRALESHEALHAEIERLKSGQK